MAPASRVFAVEPAPAAIVIRSTTASPTWLVSAATKSIARTPFFRCQPHSPARSRLSSF